MPTNYGSQNVRVSTGLLNTVNDEAPGGGASAQFKATSIVPGYAPGQLGQRVILGKNEVKYDAHVGTLYEGTYQYVQTLSTDQTHAALGLEAFWSDRDKYIVTTSDAVGAELAGIFINPITPGNYGFIFAVQGGRVNVQTSVAGGAKGDILFVNQGAGTAIALSATLAAITTAQLAVRFGKCLAAPVAGVVLAALDTQTD
jgi:hypothetical protein